MATKPWKRRDFDRTIDELLGQGSDVPVPAPTTGTEVGRLSGIPVVRPSPAAARTVVPTVSAVRRMDEAITGKAKLPVSAPSLPGVTFDPKLKPGQLMYLDPLTNRVGSEFKQGFKPLYVNRMGEVSLEPDPETYKHPVLPDSYLPTISADLKDGDRMYFDQAANKFTNKPDATSVPVYFHRGQYKINIKPDEMAYAQLARFNAEFAANLTTDHKPVPIPEAVVFTRQDVGWASPAMVQPDIEEVRVTGGWRISPPEATTAALGETRSMMGDQLYTTAVGPVSVSPDLGLDWISASSRWFKERFGANYAEKDQSIAPKLGLMNKFLRAVAQPFVAVFNLFTTINDPTPDNRLLFGPEAHASGLTPQQVIEQNKRTYLNLFRIWQETSEIYKDTFDYIAEGQFNSNLTRAELLAEKKPMRHGNIPTLNEYVLETTGESFYDGYNKLPASVREWWYQYKYNEYMHAIKPLVDSETERLTQSVVNMHNEAHRIVREGRGEEAIQLLVSSYDIQRDLATTDPTWSYTWLDDDGEVRRNSFLRSMAEVELQLNRRLTVQEVYDLKARFERPSSEFMGEIVFDWLNAFDLFIPLPGVALKRIFGQTTKVSRFGDIPVEIIRRGGGAVIQGMKNATEGTKLDFIFRKARKSTAARMMNMIDDVVYSASRRPIVAGKSARQMLVDDVSVIGENVAGILASPNRDEAMEALLASGKLSKNVTKRQLEHALELVDSGISPERWGETVNAAWEKVERGMFDEYLKRYQEAFNKSANVIDARKEISGLLKLGVLDETQMARLNDLTTMIKTGEDELADMARIATQRTEDLSKFVSAEVGEQFRSEYLAAHRAWQGTELLDDSLLGTIGRNIPSAGLREVLNIWNKLHHVFMSLWIPAVLGRRPSWLVFNYLESSLRVLTSKSPEALVSLVDIGQEIGKTPITLGTSLAQMGLAAIDGPIQILKNNPEGWHPGITSFVAQFSHQIDNYTRRWGKYFGGENTSKLKRIGGGVYAVFDTQRVWTNTISGMSHMVEFALRTRLFGKETVKMIRRLEDALLPGMLDNLAARLRAKGLTLPQVLEYQDIFVSAWHTAGGDADRFRLLLDPKGGMTVSNWIPAKLYKTPFFMSSEDIVQFLGSIKDNLDDFIAGYRQAGKDIDADAIRTFFDGHIKLIDEQMEMRLRYGEFDVLLKTDERYAKIAENLDPVLTSLDDELVDFLARDPADLPKSWGKGAKKAERQGKFLAHDIDIKGKSVKEATEELRKKVSRESEEAANELAEVVKQAEEEATKHLAENPRIVRMRQAQTAKRLANEASRDPRVLQAGVERARAMSRLDSVLEELMIGDVPRIRPGVLSMVHEFQNSIRAWSTALDTFFLHNFPGSAKLNKPVHWESYWVIHANAYIQEAALLRRFTDEVLAGAARPLSLGEYLQQTAHITFDFADDGKIIGMRLPDPTTGTVMPFGARSQNLMEFKSYFDISDAKDLEKTVTGLDATVRVMPAPTVPSLNELSAGNAQLARAIADGDNKTAAIQIANEFKIATASEKGRPVDRLLLNTINKQRLNMGLPKAKSLKELTPDDVYSALRNREGEKVIVTSVPKPTIYGRAEFERDWREVWQLPDKQVKELMLVLDGMAEHWARLYGKTVDEFFPTFFERMQRGIDGNVDALYQDAQTWYYSQLRRTVENIPQERMTVEQLRGMIRKGAVKEDELKWTGLDDFLDERKPTDKVSRQEVIDYIQANEVRISETVLGEPEQGKIHLNWSEQEKDYFIVTPNAIDSNNRYIVISEAADAAIWGGETGSGWIVTGLGFPRKRFDTFDKAAEAVNNHFYSIYPFGSDVLVGLGRRTQYDRLGLVVPHGSDYRELLLKWGDTGYLSSHFGEEGQDLLASVRFTTRVDEDGKRVLFIEEVQSDWHQRGMAEGYTRISSRDRAALQEEFNQFDNRIDEIERIHPELFAINRQINQLDEIYNTLTQSGDIVGAAKIQEELVQLSLARLDKHGQIPQIVELNQRREEVSRLLWEGSIPAAPFAKNWDELSMKRMIRWASENGYDRIAWTPSEVHIARYNLAKELDVLRYEKAGDGVSLVGIRSGDIVSSRDLKMRDLHNAIGEDAANRIRNSAEMSGKLVGGNLTIGGDFMRMLYDDRLKSVANKHGKKWGTQVGTTRIPTYFKRRDFLTVPSMDIPDNMRDSVMQGQALFQSQKAATSFEANGKAVLHALENPDITSAIHEIAHVFVGMLPDSDIRTVERMFTQNRINFNPDWIVNKIANREAHEFFARAVERYFATGQAPTRKLSRVFKHMKQWFLSIYKKIKGSDIDVPISAEFRAMMDNWLTEENRQLTEMWNTYLDFPQFGTGKESYSLRKLLSPLTDNISHVNDPAEAVFMLERKIAEYADRPELQRIVQEMHDKVKYWQHYVDHMFVKKDIYVTPPIPMWRYGREMQAWLTSRYALLAQREDTIRALRLWRDELVDAVDTGKWYTKEHPPEALEAISEVGDDAARLKAEIVDSSIYGGDVRGVNVAEGSLASVNRTMLDYTDYYAWENPIRAIIPFWMFPSRSIMYWGEMITAHPNLLAFYNKYLDASERISYEQGGTNSRGEQLPSLRGFIPLGNSGLWFNPTAFLPLRFLFPNPNLRSIADEDELTPLQSISQFLMEESQMRGFGLSPVVHWILSSYGVSPSFPRPTPGYEIARTLFPIDLLPIWYERYVQQKIKQIGYPGWPDVWQPEVGWKDYLIEIHILEDAYENIQRAKTHEEKMAAAKVAYEIIKDPKREDNTAWLEHRHEVEQSEYWRRIAGYVTGFFLKPFTPARMEILAIRDRINILRDSINVEIMGELFSPYEDALQRYSHYLENRYDTPEGWIWNTRQKISWVTDENGNQLEGQARLDRIHQNFTEEEAAEAYYAAIKSNNDWLQEQLKNLPIGAPGSFKEEIYEQWYANRIDIELADEYEAAQRAWVVGYKPNVLLENHIRDMAWHMIKDTRPLYDAENETFNEYMVRLEHWGEELRWQGELLLPVLATNIAMYQDELHSGQSFEGVLDRLKKEFTLEGFEEWDKERDTPLDAAERAWRELYFNAFWSALEGLSGDRRELAERQFIANNPNPPTTDEMWQWIQKNYKTPNFTREEFYASMLKSEGSTRESLAIEERMDINKTEFERLANEVWDILNWTNPGAQRSELRNAYETLGGDASDFDVWYAASEDWMKRRPEEFMQFYNRLKTAAAMIKVTRPTNEVLVERIKARDMNDLFHDIVEQQLGVDSEQIRGEYYRLNSQERRQWRTDNPAMYERHIRGYHKIKDAFAKANPLWAKYYYPDYEADTVQAGVSGVGGVGGVGGRGVQRRATATRTRAAEGTAWDFIPMGYRTTLDPNQLLRPGVVGSGRYAGTIRKTATHLADIEAIADAEEGEA